MLKVIELTCGNITLEAHWTGYTDLEVELEGGGGWMKVHVSPEKLRELRDAINEVLEWSGEGKR